MGDPVGAEREACAGNSQGKQAEVRRDFGAVGADVRAVPNSRAAFPAISAGCPIIYSASGCGCEGDLP